MKSALTLIVLSLISFSSFGETSDSIKLAYNNSYDSLVKILESKSEQSFKKAIFLVENCYTLNQLEYEKFNQYISQLAAIIKMWEHANFLVDYRYSDSNNLQKNCAIYKFLKDTIRFVSNENKKYNLLPYTYDLTDFLGEKDWGYMFVTKLLSTHSGNCHSLPYLYKILADELGVTCWLSLAPNHMYIKNRCKEIGWYNTELTSGDFPIDAWIMASGYLPVKAVQSGIYMDTLSNQQSIALCVLDLAKGYEHQTKNYYDGFIIKCCDLSLQYFPLNIQVMLLKAETLKRVYEKQHADKDKAAKSTYKEMENLYAKIFDLGYREMPPKMYQQWLQSVMKEKEKYSNPKMKQVMQTAKGK